MTPTHIAFIMDGNGRWAKARGLPRLEGHRRGVETLRGLLTALAERGIPHATFYAFSTENWRRSADEVDGLMNLFRWFLKAELKKLADGGIRLRFLGDRRPGGRLPDDILALMADSEAATAANTRLNVNICLNYGGRAEILAAAQALAEKAKAGALNPATLTEDDVSAHLTTAGLPDPDLCIRTSGEQRTSNFLPWQLAYAELMFVDTAWPDFTPEKLDEALAAFARRDRRFGGVSVA